MTDYVTAISRLWSDRDGYPQMLIVGLGLGYAKSLGLQKGSDNPRTGISIQKDKGGVKAVIRARPNDLHHLLARLIIVLEE